MLYLFVLKTNKKILEVPDMGRVEIEGRCGKYKGRTREI